MAVILYDRATNHKLAYLDDVLVKDSLTVSSAVNGEFYASFEVVEPPGDEVARQKCAYLQRPVYIEVDGDFFDLSYVEQIHGETLRYKAECEHVSYRLIDHQLLDISYFNTPGNILRSMLFGTEFTAGSADFAGTVEYYDPQPKSASYALKTFADLLGGRLCFEGFSIGLQALPSEDKGFTARFGKNIKSLTKITDRRSGAVYYELSLVDLRNHPLYEDLRDLETVALGDPIRIIDEAAGTDELLYVLSRSYRQNGETVALEIGNRVELLSDSINALSKSFKNRQIVLDHKPTESEAARFALGSLIHVYNPKNYRDGLYPVPHIFYRAPEQADIVLTDVAGTVVLEGSWSETGLHFPSSPHTPIRTAVIGDEVYLLHGNNRNFRYNESRPKESRFLTIANHSALTELWYDPVAAAQGSVQAIFGDKHCGYDPATDTWQRYDSEFFETYQGAAGYGLADYFLILGGMHLEPFVLARDSNTAYDPATDTWHIKAAMPTGRTHLACAVIGSMAYASGGANVATGETLASFERYDYELDLWSELPPLPTARCTHASVALCGSVYVIGGNLFNGHDESIGLSIESYDTLTGTWRVHEVPPVHLVSHGAAALSGKITVFGRGGTLGAEGRVLHFTPPLYSYAYELEAGYAVKPGQDCLVYPSMQDLPADTWTTVTEAGTLCGYHSLISAVIRHGSLEEQAEFTVGTLSGWERDNPVLETGQGAIVLDGNHVGIKFGDGATAFQDLRYTVFSLYVNGERMEPREAPYAELTVPRTPYEIGAATAAQGARADTALQSLPFATETVTGGVTLGVPGGAARFGSKADVGLDKVPNVDTSNAENITSGLMEAERIAQSPLHRFVSDAQIALWSTGSGSATPAPLFDHPPTAEEVEALEEGTLFHWYDAQGEAMENGSLRVESAYKPPGEAIEGDFVYTIEESWHTIYLQAPGDTFQAADFVIDWGDGEQTVAFNNGSTAVACHHSYPSYGVWTVRFLQFQSGSFRWSGQSSPKEILTPLPKNMFTQDATAPLYGFFTGCYALTSIPEKLFVNYPDVSHFVYCFVDCGNLASIPKKLFDYVPGAVNFDNCFDNCGALTGDAPPLWLRSDPDTSGLCCFRGCTGLSNYEEIPAEWK